MKFKANGITYQEDMFGVIHQVDKEDFVYDEKYNSTYDTPAYQDKSEVLQALRLSYACGAHGTTPKSLIDVGYGTGAFMRMAKKLIPVVGGKDISGVPVPEGCFKADEFLPVDVVTFFDSLEHMPDLMFVRDIPAQTIVISLPYCHIKDRGVDWFEKDYFHLKKNEHLHHFDEKSLENFMDNMGWYRTGVASLEDIVRKRDHEWNILTCSFKRKKEIWKDVEGWEDKYQISSFGRVKSLPRLIGGGRGYWSQERVLHENNRDGYKIVSFPIENRKSQTVNIHQLVARSFVSNPDNKPMVNHKNGIRWHNYATNVEWSTAQENVQHGFDYNGRIVDQTVNKKPIKQMTLTGGLVKVWPSGLEMEKQSGFNRSTVVAAIKNGKHYYGYKWEYA